MENTELENMESGNTDLGDTDLKTSDFYFELPPNLIAQDPLPDRSASRLLVLNKDTGETEHHVFREIADYLSPGDCLVLNNTKVIPARLMGRKEGPGASIGVWLQKGGKRMFGRLW